MRRKRAKFASCSALREPGNEVAIVDCTIHGKELGSILLRHRIKEYPGLGVHTIPGGGVEGLLKT